MGPYPSAYLGRFRSIPGRLYLAVGVHAGDCLPVTLWYPAKDDGRGEVRSSYAYPLKWFVRLDRVAPVVARARWNAPFDPSLGPRPVVVLSPGFTVPRSGYAWLAERLATHGFLVVALERDEVMTEPWPTTRPPPGPTSPPRATSRHLGLRS